MLPGELGRRLFGHLAHRSLARRELAGEHLRGLGEHLLVGRLELEGQLRRRQQLRPHVEVLPHARQKVVECEEDLPGEVGHPLGAQRRAAPPAERRPLKLAEEDLERRCEEFEEVPYDWRVAPRPRGRPRRAALDRGTHGHPRLALPRQLELLVEARREVRDPAADERRHQRTHVGHALAEIQRRQPRNAQPPVKLAQQRPHARPVLKGAQGVVDAADHAVGRRVAQGVQRGLSGCHQQPQPRAQRRPVRVATVHLQRAPKVALVELEILDGEAAELGKPRGREGRVEGRHEGGRARVGRRQYQPMAVLLLQPPQRRLRNRSPRQPRPATAIATGGCFIVVRRGRGRRGGGGVGGALGGRLGGIGGRDRRLGVGVGVRVVRLRLDARHELLKV